MQSKSVVLCADDYGQNSAISAGILTLARSARLSAISCMSAATHWPHAAQALRDAAPEVDIGLHFTLTGISYLADEGAENTPTRHYGHSALIRDAYLGRLDKDTIIQSLHNQLDRFETHLGRLPDFIDGHQHIHQLPTVRDALLEVCSDRLRGHAYYIRCLARISSRAPALTKSLIIQALGAQALERELRRRKVMFNPDFAGIYNFATTDYRKLILHWMKHADHGALIMCHPGEASQDRHDPIRQSREIEFQYFKSDLFHQDCERENVRLVRGHDAGWI